jgi:hypothetical protein
MSRADQTKRKISLVDDTTSLDDAKRRKVVDNDSDYTGSEVSDSDTEMDLPFLNKPPTVRTFTLCI